MIRFLLEMFVRAALALRYRIRVRGLARVAARGRAGILFLPNHPALIDPIIVLTILSRPFRPRALADRDQVDRFFIRFLARRTGVRTIPDIAKYGPDRREEIRAILDECIEGLRRGENLVLYPAGHLYRSRFEDLRGNSAVERALREVPRLRVVLVRTRGLWGSVFSQAPGHMPHVARVIRRAVRSLLLSGVFFAPRRRVTIDLHEPSDLPAGADRNTLNAFLEAFYNEAAPPNTYVPHAIWEGGGARELPDPPARTIAGDLSGVSPATRRLVAHYLRELTGKGDIRDEDHLARDLGLDSLARADLLVWLGRDFGYPQSDTDSLRTVADVMLGAAGEALSDRPVTLEPPPATWFRARRGDRRLHAAAGRNITEAFLNRARRHPRKAVIADQRSGGRSCRDLVAAIIALRPAIASLPGRRIGIMLPASVAAGVTYLAALFAGKTPVMVNWTLGARSVEHCLGLAEVRKVLTSEALVSRLTGQGADLSALSGRLVFLEEIARRVPRRRKLLAWLRSRLSWSCLREAPVSETAAVLFTSGSEAFPKAVPLTHENILTNVRDLTSAITVLESDALLGMLPPFHSFALTVTVVLPLLTGLPTVYHADPTEGATLGRLIESYKVSLLVAAPGLLGGLAAASTSEQLAPLRLTVMGAETCPPRTRDALRRRCPQMKIIEGYGVTEASPAICVDDEAAPRPGAIGRVLPSLSYAIVDAESGRRVAPGDDGLLLVRGPSVFAGYIGYEGPSPFVTFEGERWYRTGDLVREDADGVLTFRGRLKRFVKLGGEMISLPAIESVLEPHYVAQGDEGPTVAVEAAGAEDRPELVLFTTKPTDRETANRQIREAGLSALHNVRRVVRLDEIPVLGTGKTDYRALRDMLARQ
jgi:long-chain-fatty-acid--[acyl-carrier-protein] ligase